MKVVSSWPRNRLSYLKFPLFLLTAVSKNHIKQRGQWAARLYTFPIPCPMLNHMSEAFQTSLWPCGITTMSYQGRGIARLFKMRGQQGGDQGWAGGLIGTQNGGSPIDLCTKCNFIWGWARGGQSFCQGVVAPLPPWLCHCTRGQIQVTLAKRAPRSTSKIPFWRSPVRFFLWT